MDSYELNPYQHATHWRADLPTFLLGLAVCVFPAQAMAVTCDVPTQRPTVQSAIDDVSCTEIRMLAGTFVESINIARSLTLRGLAANGAVVQGAASVSGSEVLVTLTDFVIENGCNAPGLSATASAQVDTRNLVVQSSSLFSCTVGEIIFSNGFENL